MRALNAADPACCLEAPERNRYFHGQMLYERNFRLETDYHNGKRWLINRLVVGWGVVCGLGLEVCEGEEPAIALAPGVAIDRWGREIVVDCASGPIAVPPWLLRGPKEGGGGKPGRPNGGAGGYGHPHGGEEEEEESYGGEPGRRNRPAEEAYGGGEERPHGRGKREHGLHVVLCYHECVAEPTAVLAGDCRDEEPCQPGMIRERWALDFRPGCLPPRKVKLSIPDVVDADGRVDYETLVKAVSEPCPCPDDPCIPLANLYLDVDESGRCRCRREIDLSVRPIVYTNDLLFQLILSAAVEAPAYRREK